MNQLSQITADTAPAPSAMKREFVSCDPGLQAIHELTFQFSGKIVIFGYFFPHNARESAKNTGSFGFWRVKLLAGSAQA